MTRIRTKDIADNNQKKPPFIINWVVAKVKSYDKFAVSAPPFNFGGKGSTPTFFGGLLGLFI